MLANLLINLVIFLIGVLAGTGGTVLFVFYLWEKDVETEIALEGQ